MGDARSYYSGSFFWSAPGSHIPRSTAHTAASPGGPVAASLRPTRQADAPHRSLTYRENGRQRSGNEISPGVCVTRHEGVKAKEDKTPPVLYLFVE
jgi:hypothetical protein